MKLLILIFCCLALLATQLLGADGINCYACSYCKDPFKKEDHTVTSGHTYCMKTVIAGHAARLGGNGSCTQGTIGGNGVFCCQTDLCNGGEVKFSVRTAILSVTTGSLVLLLQAKLF